MGRIRVTNYIVKRLCEIEGIEYIFGITGKSISAMVDACCDYEDLQFITSRHEAGASYMALGYAQSTGKLGICLGTSGGGATNMATGVASAYMNSIPMIVFSGQVPVANFGKGAFQESTGIGRTMNVVDVFKPITKASLSIEHPDLIPNLLSHAIKLAYSGRPGPVHITIPIDVQLAEIEDITHNVRTPVLSEPLRYVSEGALSESITLLRNAKQPVLFAGWGSVLAKAEKEILEFAELLNIPFMTTPQAKGALSADHPLYLGVMGLGGHRTTTEYLTHSDLLIAVGTTFNEFATLNWNPGFHKVNKIIQIDIDPTEIDKNIVTDLSIVGDAKAVFTLLNREAKGIKKKSLVNGFSETIMKNRFDEPDKMYNKSTPIKPQRLLYEIRKSTPDNTIFLADSGSHCSWALNYLDIYTGGHFYPAFGLGAMGITVASSMGIQLAKPDQAVVAIVGDGTLAMHGTELAVAAQYNIPVIWVVMNDSMYAMPAQGSMRMYGRTSGVELSEINFAKFAESLGISGYTVHSPDKVGAIIEYHIKIKQPAVIDVYIDKTEVPSVGARLNYGQKTEEQNKALNTA